MQQIRYAAGSPAAAAGGAHLGGQVALRRDALAGRRQPAVRDACPLHVWYLGAERAPPAVPLPGVPSKACKWGGKRRCYWPGGCCSLECEAPAAAEPTGAGAGNEWAPRTPEAHPCARREGFASFCCAQPLPSSRTASVARMGLGRESASWSSSSAPSVKRKARTQGRDPAAFPRCAGRPQPRARKATRGRAGLLQPEARADSMMIELPLRDEPRLVSTDSKGR